MTVDSVGGRHWKEDVNVLFWLCAGLWNTEVYLGPQWDVRKSSLRISCMILDGIIFSYRGKIVLEMTLFYSLQKQERHASGNWMKQELPFLFFLFPEGTQGNESTLILPSVPLSEGLPSIYWVPKGKRPSSRYLWYLSLWLVLKIKDTWCSNPKQQA